MGKTYLANTVYVYKLLDTLEILCLLQARKAVAQYREFKLLDTATALTALVVVPAPLESYE